MAAAGVEEDEDTVRVEEGVGDGVLLLGGDAVDEIEGLVE
jgi:hypothetical protein